MDVTIESSNQTLLQSRLVWGVMAPGLVAGLALLGGVWGGRGGANDEADPGRSGASTSACIDGGSPEYPHAREPIGTVREMYDGTLSPELAVNTYRNIDRLFPTRVVARGRAVHPLPRAAQPLTEVSFTTGGVRYTLDDFLQRNRVAALLVLKDGRIAFEGCRYGNTAGTRWMSMSVAKSVTSTLIGAALQDGYIGSLDDPVTRYVPRLKGSAYDGATVRHVLTMSSGVRWSEAYADPASDRRQLLEAQISQTPGAAMALMSRLPRAAAPGSAINYSTGETQVAAEILTGAVKRPLAQYLSERLWARMGMEADARWWLDSPDGVEIGGSGLSATLRDYGRFGLFVMNDGVIDGQHILPPGWVDQAGSPHTLSTGRRVNYGYLWWMPGGRSAEEGAFLAIGIMGQQIYIHRREKVVIVVWGAQTDSTGIGTLPATLFFEAVVEALRTPE